MVAIASLFPDMVMSSPAVAKRATGSLRTDAPTVWEGIGAATRGPGIARTLGARAALATLGGHGEWGADDVVDRRGGARACTARPRARGADHRAARVRPRSAAHAARRPAPVDEPRGRGAAARRRAA